MGETRGENKRGGRMQETERRQTERGGGQRERERVCFNFNKTRLINSADCL